MKIKKKKKKKLESVLISDNITTYRWIFRVFARFICETKFYFSFQWLRTLHFEYLLQILTAGFDISVHSIHDIPIKRNKRMRFRSTIKIFLYIFRTQINKNWSESESLEMSLGSSSELVVKGEAIESESDEEIVHDFRENTHSIVGILLFLHLPDQQIL